MQKCINFLRELKHLVEKLRSHAAQTIRIEMAPWAKPYTVDMKDVHTELTLETEPQGLKVKDYKQLFLNTTVAQKTQLRSLKKILIKGRQGFGKSSFAKKIYFDWSKRIFTEFDIVFFVSTTLVKSFHGIEEEIIRQAPPLIETNIGKENIRDFLDYLGSRCLIVLDSSDEDSEKVTKLLTSLRSRCSFLVTSLPDTTPEFDEWFDTIGEIQALTNNQVKQLVSYVPRLEPLAVPMMKLCTENSMIESQSLSPMLILFVCILVDNSELDVTKRNLNLGDVYFRLVRYLHNKYSSSTFESSGVDYLKELGKIALKGLSENRHSFQRREIDQVCCGNPFPNGFMRSQESFGKKNDSKAEGVVTFVHIFFQHYFAFLHVVFTGSSTETEFPSAFFTLPRFCDFCLQLLRTDTLLYGHEMRTNAYTKIKLLFVKNMNNVNLQLNPVLKMCHRFKEIFQLVQTVLSMCKKIKHIVLDSNLSDFDVVTFEPIWPQLLSVQLIDLSRYITPKDDIAFRSENLVIFADTPMVEKVKRLVYTFNAIGKKLHLHWFGQVDLLDLSVFPIEYLNELHIEPPNQCKITPGNGIGLAGHLTRLSLCNMDFDESVFSALTKALVNCILTDLSFADSNLAGHLKELFPPKLIWPSLRHLNLRKCKLLADDFTALEMISQEKLVPQLDSLVISHFSMFATPIVLALPQITALHMDSVLWEEFKVFVTLMNIGMLPKLKDLQVCVRQESIEMESFIEDQCLYIENWLRNYLVERFPDFDSETANYWSDFLQRLSSGQTVSTEHMDIETLIHVGFNRLSSSPERHYKVSKINAKFACLTTLDFSNSLDIAEHLVDIGSHSCLTLNTLILSNCRLTSEDLKIVAKVYSENKLPLLKHLDISKNTITHDKHSLFEYGSKWESLLTLSVQKSSLDWLSYLGRKFRSGCLSSLQELKVDVNESVLAEYYTIWPSLRKLHFYMWTPDVDYKNLLVALRDLVQKGVFANLTTVLVYRSLVSDTSECDVGKELIELISVSAQDREPLSFPNTSPPDLLRQTIIKEARPYELNADQDIMTAQFTGKMSTLF